MKNRLQKKCWVSIDFCMHIVYVNVLVFFLESLLVCQSWNSLEDKTYLLLWNVATDIFGSVCQI